MKATNPKLSESLLDFAQPLLELAPDGAGPAEMAPVLRIAILVWNAVALEALGRETPYIDQARSAISTNTSDPGRDLMLAMLADMESRKRSEHPMDTRLIGDFEFITGEQGETRLRVNCHVPKPEGPTSSGCSTTAGDPDQPRPPVPRAARPK